MERQELIDFLRENLSVELTTETGYDYGSDYVVINVAITTSDENGNRIIISEDSDSISINN